MAENPEPNEIDEEVLHEIESQASWDEELDYFISLYADIFLKHQISIGDAFIAYKTNQVRNRLHSLGNEILEKLEEIKEAL